MIRLSIHVARALLGLVAVTPIAAISDTPALSLDECSIDATTDHCGTSRWTLQSAENSTLTVWLFGFASVTVISLCSCIGFLLLPPYRQSHEWLFNLFEGLAAGSLLASGLFHLIPHAFDLVGEDPLHGYLWRSLFVFVGIYIFYCSEKAMKLFSWDSKGRRPSHGRRSRVSISETDHPVAKNVSNKVKVISTLAWMVLLGDGLHNFIDGLSIGAAASDSLLTGMSISLAVVFEEIPHELGDMAILVGSGMTVKEAMAYNFLSACTCYLGMAVGILVGDLTEHNTLIFAVAGGMFLYIALVDLMAELTVHFECALHESGTRSALTVLAAQNAGILTGVTILFLLARFDENFKFN